MAWIHEVSSTPDSATDPPEPTPSKQAKRIAGALREWLDIIKGDSKKYVSLEAKNPVVNQAGVSLCGHIAKKVSSWFTTPADLALLVELVKDYKLSTQASNPTTILKAILVAMVSREFDPNPELLLVSKSDIMTIMKQK